MRILLDTHLLIWLSTAPERLPLAVRELLNSASTEACFSDVSIWETSIKFSLGRPDFSLPYRELLKDALKSGLTQLTISTEHVVRVGSLPPFHRDPFDRLLIAQAQVDGLLLLTVDHALERYGPYVRAI